MSHIVHIEESGSLCALLYIRGRVRFQLQIDKRVAVMFLCKKTLIFNESCDRRCLMLTHTGFHLKLH